MLYKTVTVYKSLCSVKFLSISVGSCASAQEPLNFPRLEKVKQTDGNTEEKRDELLRGNISRKSHSLSLSLSALSLILHSWQLLAMSYLLLIRYEAVSSTPVMGLEIVALRSCEARDMIYPRADTQAHTCKHVCASVFASPAAPHQPASQLDLPPLNTKPNKRD